MQRCLVVIGCQKEKLMQCGRDGQKLVTWIQARSDQYDSVISIVRKDLQYDNFNKMGDEIANKDDTILGYATDTLIEVPGYDVDCSKFRRDMEYDIVGISTAASVLCIAMSMFSNGLKVHVLTDHCLDRKSKKLHNAAIEIMKAYMPIAVV